MQNVTINSKKYGTDGEAPLKLNNGSLVIHYNRLGDVLGAYLVTSFRDNRGRYSGDYTTSYCSLINLDNGYIQFEERCSRNTTVKRVLSHLNKGDYYGAQAVKDGQYLEVYSTGDFQIDLKFDRKSV